MTRQSGPLPPYWRKMMSDEDRIAADLKFLRQVHQMGKNMRQSDEEIIKIAKTNGNIHPEAMKKYLADYE